MRVIGLAGSLRSCGSGVENKYRGDSGDAAAVAALRRSYRKDRGAGGTFHRGTCRAGCACAVSVSEASAGRIRVQNCAVREFGCFSVDAVVQIKRMWLCGRDSSHSISEISAIRGLQVVAAILRAAVCSGMQLCPKCAAGFVYQ